MRRSLAALAFLCTATAAAPDAVQPLTTWDGIYTEAQADRGEKLYADR